MSQSQKRFLSATEKRRRALIAAAVVLLLAAAAFAAVTIATSKSEAQNETEETGTVLSDEDAKELTKLEWTCEGRTLSFTYDRSSELWSRTGDPEYPASQDILARMAESVSSLTAVRSFSADNGSSYGFDEPYLTISAEYASDPGTRLFTFGSKNEMTAEYYVKTDGSDEIYTVASSAVPYFSFSETELIEKETIPSPQRGDIVSVTVRRGDFEYEMADETALARVPALSLYNVADYRPDDAVKEAYGLDDAQASVITVRYNVTKQITSTDSSKAITGTAGVVTEQSYTLRVGSLCFDDADYRYAMYGDSPVVYRVKAEAADTVIGTLQ